LVVEDDPAIRRVVVDALGFAGYAVSEADDGRRGLELGSSGNFDLVLLDVMLPELDGFEVLKGLRSRQPRLPVIMLTAMGGEHERVRGCRRLRGQALQPGRAHRARRGRAAPFGGAPSGGA
jgi:DNA-binding response OmpR family regulator